MILLIEGRQAVIKKDTSVELNLENRLFSGAEGYTLTITLPLRGCPENLAIFGSINRVADVPPRNIIRSCEIRHGADISIRGCVTITEITPDEVKVQFLEGRSAQNFDDTLDNRYIDTLTLGNTCLSGSDFTPDRAYYAGVADRSCVALPFYSRTDDELYNISSDQLWHTDPPSPSVGKNELAWQPYLLELTRRICVAIRYQADLSLWEADPARSLYLVTNTLPPHYGRPDLAAILPHWSVAEYFDNLELFLDCTFDIDHAAQTVTYRPNRSLVADAGEIILDDIADEISSTVEAQEPSCDYIGCKNIEYDSPGDWFDDDSCPWIFDIHSPLRFPTFAEFSAAWHNHRNAGFYNFWAYIEELDIHVDRATFSVSVKTDKTPTGSPRYSILRQVRPQQINTFGPLVVDNSENSKTESVKISPADVTWHESGLRCIHLSHGDLPDEVTDDDILEHTSHLTSYSDFENYVATEDFRSTVQALIENGQKDQSPFYDTLHIAWWDGTPFSPDALPFPYVEDITIDDDCTRYLRHPFSMRLTDRAPMTGDAPASDNPGASSLPAIDPRRKTTVRFLIGAARCPDGTPVPGIPSQYSLFNIRGKRYLCEKLTATFTPDGVSRLLKATLWPILNS